MLSLNHARSQEIKQKLKKQESEAQKVLNEKSNFKVPKDTSPGPTHKEQNAEVSRTLDMSIA